MIAMWIDLSWSLSGFVVGFIAGTLFAWGTKIHG